jgi:hypothetical protein
MEDESATGITLVELTPTASPDELVASDQPRRRVITVRLAAKQHRELMLQADRLGLSLNQLCVVRLAETIDQASVPMAWLELYRSRLAARRRERKQQEGAEVTK